MTLKCVCQTCRYAFPNETQLCECPRCHSPNVLCRPLQPGEKEAFSSAQVKKESLTTGKASWREFHLSGASQKCPKCNGSNFKLDYKHKEKICLTCGDILALPRTGN